MPNQVPVHIARDRNRILRELAAEKTLAFMRTFIGKEIEAITLAPDAAHSCGAGTPAREASVPESTGQPEKAPTSTEALTDNYLKLHLHGRHEPNRWLRAHIEAVENRALRGLILTSS
jgi:tRNA A37 methylthiotransferase MiaB